MNRRELGLAPRRAAVPETYHWIETVHEPSPTPPDFLCPSSGPDGTRVTGAYERGARRPVLRHSTEAAACARLPGMPA
ncbi:hypothetical protein [Streptomyces sp. CAU 1734]|uniref:hypothetical protein n=1 Tax=Streptomyces sp. CAU 1734 TaxID=3140360 RepID=UPI003260AB25